MTRLILDVDEYKGVGPYTNVYGHGPVTGIAPPNEGFELVVCLECGYTTGDIRVLAHVECDREHNPMPQTWREKLAADGYPPAPEDTDEAER